MKVAIVVFFKEPIPLCVLCVKMGSSCLDKSFYALQDIFIKTIILAAELKAY